MATPTRIVGNLCFCRIDIYGYTFMSFKNNVCGDICKYAGQLKICKRRAHFDIQKEWSAICVTNMSHSIYRLPVWSIKYVLDDIIKDFHLWQKSNIITVLISIYRFSYRNITSYFVVMITSCQNIRSFRNSGRRKLYIKCEWL